MFQKMLSDHPDINDTDQMVEAIKEVQVLGGYSRSGTVDPTTGDFEPDRYVETLGEYYSDFQIKSAVEALQKNSFTISGIDGVITKLSADEIVIETAGGRVLTFHLFSDLPREVYYL